MQYVPWIQAEIGLDKQGQRETSQDQPAIEERHPTEQPPSSRRLHRRGHVTDRPQLRRSKVHGLPHPQSATALQGL